MKREFQSIGKTCNQFLANLLQIAVVWSAPMNKPSHAVPITLSHFFLIGAVAISMLWKEEIRKWFAHRQVDRALHLMKDCTVLPAP